MNKRIVLLILLVVAAGVGIAVFFLLGGARVLMSKGGTPSAQLQPDAASPQAGSPEARTKAPEEGRVEPAAAPTPPLFYKYASFDKRDPFIPLVTKKGEEKFKGAPPLESHEVSEIKLIGVVWTSKGYFAQVALPGGKSYTLREGTRLGPQGGRVVKITKDTVTIRENVRDYRGILKSRDVLLKLRLEEQG